VTRSQGANTRHLHDRYRSPGMRSEPQPWRLKDLHGRYAQALFHGLGPQPLQPRARGKRSTWRSHRTCSTTDESPIHGSTGEKELWSLRSSEELADSGKSFFPREHAEGEHPHRSHMTSGSIGESLPDEEFVDTGKAVLLRSLESEVTSTGGSSTAGSLACSFTPGPEHECSAATKSQVPSPGLESQSSQSENQLNLVEVEVEVPHELREQEWRSLAQPDVDVVISHDLHSTALEEPASPTSPKCKSSSASWHQPMDPDLARHLARRSEMLDGRGSMEHVGSAARATVSWDPELLNRLARQQARVEEGITAIEPDSPKMRHSIEIVDATLAKRMSRQREKAEGLPLPSEEENASSADTSVDLIVAPTSEDAGRSSPLTALRWQEANKEKLKGNTPPGLTSLSKLQEVSNRMSWPAASTGKANSELAELLGKRRSKVDMHGVHYGRDGQIRTADAGYDTHAQQNKNEKAESKAQSAGTLQPKSPVLDADDRHDIEDTYQDDWAQLPNDNDNAIALTEPVCNPSRPSGALRSEYWIGDYSHDIEESYDHDWRCGDPSSPRLRHDTLSPRGRHDPSSRGDNHGPPAGSARAR